MQDFMPMNSKLESERLKRLGIQLGKESFKKLKTAEALVIEPTQEQQSKECKEIFEDELKKMMEIVLVEELYIKALQVKYPIIDCEIYSEDQRKFWKIIRVGNHIESYQIFDDMLKKFDREDLDRLWSFGEGDLHHNRVQHQSSSKSHRQANFSLAKGKRKLDEYVTIPETTHTGTTYETVPKGHARMLKQHADLEEKHINLLTSERRIEDGILDVKKAAAKVGVKSAESKFINALAAEI
nr:kinesin-like protein KIN-12B isoform X1 [Tanacetum cinerariifolium]